MTVFFHVARNTYRECMREPIFYVLLFTAVFLIGLFPSLAMFVFFEQIKLVADSSMATTLTFGLLAAVLSASRAVTRETRDGTLLLLLAKPVPRWLYVSAKIAGILAALTVFAVLCDLASMISLRVAVDQFRLDWKLLYMYYAMMFIASAYGAIRNFISRKPFPPPAIYALGILYAVILLLIQFKLFPFNAADSSPLYFPALPALILLIFAIWLMGAVTVTFATRLDMVPNLVVCAVLFSVGLMSDYLIGRHIQGSLIFRSLYAIVPNWQYFWKVDALASGSTIPVSYVLWAFAYVVVYIVVCAALAITLFRDREIGDRVR